MSDVRTVYQRIADAAAMIAATDFVKDGRVTGGKSYPYIPIAQILDAVRKAQAKAGVFVVFGQPEYDPDQREGRRDQSTGWTQANGHIRATIYGADGDSIETVIAFEVKDNSDKLTNLIYSNAMRNLYRTLYGIDEGKAEDDPESRNIANEPDPEAVAQAARAKETKRRQIAEKAKSDPFFKTALDLKEGQR